ncbi:carboxypeptidase-like regulatory domain-containing protein [Nubsella zeaxanthinifaciens]|uniref:carboxypeptidase-like regulatory domain-containing protein n=1 Tax=Nubsella zeaxanthinifaciens TaxID=392412 RepID=UPI000DE3A1B1|nr:carboxypeptidase-like regulatory domain-containing protein [Nubsella zeaxanthinifaciens]
MIHISKGAAKLHLRLSLNFKLLFALLFLFYPLICFSQIINGRVLNRETRRGIPFANLIYTSQEGRVGHYADSLGYFSIQKNIANLEISCIGYQTALVKRDSLEDNLEIMLHPSPINLLEVKISGKKKIDKFILGYYREKNKTIGYGSIGFSDYDKSLNNYVVTYIPNHKKDTALFISKVLYNLTYNPKHLNFLLNNLKLAVMPCKGTSLRIHLFTAEKNPIAPGKEMLKKDVIIHNDCSGTADIIADISDQNIRLPIDGVFIGLEYIELTSNKMGIYLPFYVTKFGMSEAKTYESFHQKKWFRISNGSQPQFGIEVIK